MTSDQLKFRGDEKQEIQELKPMEIITTTINYAPPVLRNFGEEHQGRKHFLSPQEEWQEKHTGKFVLSALGNTMKVWALAGASKHSQVCTECSVEGIILGGGDITIDDKERHIAVYSRSMDFGSLPNNVLEEYFRHFGYEVKADMFKEGETKGITSSTREWFKQHRIDV